MKITLNKLGKKFNRQWVFKDIDFVFEAGSQTALVGNNGSGKSTLLQIIDNYQTYSRGEIVYEYEGKVLEEEALIGKISLAAPYLELPEDFTLMEMLRFHFNLMPLRAGYVFGSILQESGLAGNEDKPIKYFSSGMKQRLKLILAIYADTPLLLLDEPCSNLDDHGIQWYHSLVSSFGSNRTLLIASNQKFEYDFCEHVLAVTDFKPKSAF